MATKDHYLASDIRRSTRTKFVENVNGYDIYSHTIRNIEGTYIVLQNATDWVAYESLPEARKAAQSILPAVLTFKVRVRFNRSRDVIGVIVNAYDANEASRKALAPYAGESTSIASISVVGIVA